MNSNMESDPTPAVVEWKILIDPKTQIANWIKLLHASDYTQRDAAVEALARQGEQSLPLLRDALRKANPDRQWWIEAAIQHAEAFKTRRRQPSSLP